MFKILKDTKSLEQSRRDDLEALGYIFVYLYKGCLPWQGMQAASKQTKYEAIMQKKMETSLESLCLGMPGIHKYLCWLTDFS